MRHDCKGSPSLSHYGRGCRCDLCRSVKSLYEKERNIRRRKAKPKKPAGKRDSPFVLDDAFTREQILEARS